MRSKVIFLFSGQGSHYRGMGRELFETNVTFGQSIQRFERQLKASLGISLVTELYETKGIFNDLLITHPSIVAVELAMLNVMRENQIHPDLVIGTSLGEFASAVTTGALSEEEAIMASVEQARTIIQSSSEGGMIAVISNKTSELMNEIEASQIFLASDNFDNHFTVSGSVAGLERFEGFLKRKNIAFQRLDIKYPFHSPLIRSKRNLGVSTEKRYVTRGEMYSSIDQERLTELDIDEYFWSAVSRPFYFQNLSSYMEKNYGPCIYIDLGPSGTMATFVKYNLNPSSQSITFPIMSQFKGEGKRVERLIDIIHGN